MTGTKVFQKEFSSKTEACEITVDYPDKTVITKADIWNKLTETIPICPSSSDK